jgi:DNA-binding response OmpR family regulator
MKILLVEDNEKAARVLARGLQEEGFQVQIAHSATEADRLAACSPDLVILDWMLPDRDGIALCQEWRARGATVPILMLTARDGVTDRIAGLNEGADDYLTKPFVFDELLARVRALLRRAERVHLPLIRVADLVIDPHTRVVSRDGVVLDLTPKEYAILTFLIHHADNVVSRLQLAEHVWHADLIAIDNLMDVHMKNLRRKLDPPDRPALIHTVRGRGFMLSAKGGDGT